MIALAVCAILLWVLVEDVSRFRVRNLAVVILLASFVLDCLARGRHDLLATHGLLAAASFVVLLGAFVLGGIGGGDAKLLTAAMLWVGPEDAALFSLMLLAATGLYWLGARFGPLPRKRLGTRSAIPFGAPIAVAWIAVVGLQAWVAAP